PPAAQAAAVASPAPVQVAEGEETAEEPTESKPSGSGWGLGLGSVTIDGEVFYQIALRPELTFGKIGIGLDLVGYMDAEGRFRKDEWDEPSDYLDKLYYLRYATEEDPFFLRIGAMPAVQYGFGGLMSNYSNVTEYPQVRRVGFEMGGRIKEAFHLKAFTADLKEGGGLVGVRGTYRVSKAFPLTLGVNFVADLDQYGGLRDKDGDGRPDVVDDFPDNKRFWLDTDGDLIPDNDSLELDLDGDNLTDVIYPNDPRFPGYTGSDIVYLDTDIVQDPQPFNKKDEKRSITGISVDPSYPIISREMLSLVAYMEFSQLNYGDTLFAVKNDGTTISSKSGTGIVGPGIRAQLFKFLSVSLEYRQTSSLYQPGFFNSTYDFERAQFQPDTTATGEPSTAVITKDQAMINNPYDLTGYFGSAAANIFNIVTFGASYQNLTNASDTSALESNSFTADLSVNTDFIPKLTEARAYYVRTNDDNPLDFANPSSNTTWGYRVGYEVAAGVSMIYNMQVSYRGEEEVRLLSVETAFRF
ncbi:MAG: hypothetical protein V3W14_13520, partial [Candidatus Neomarinimicrobiota bacterium]